MDQKKLLEKIAELHHDAWVSWSKAIAPHVQDPEVLERWQTNWVPYDQLDNPTKDKDREWALEVMEILEPVLEAQPALEMVTKVDETEYPALARFLRQEESAEAANELLDRVTAKDQGIWSYEFPKIVEAKKAIQVALRETLRQGNLNEAMKKSLQAQAQESIDALDALIETITSKQFKATELL